MDEQQWDQLLWALSKGKCLFLLGAGASTYERGGADVPLTTGLSLHLAALLEAAGNPVEKEDAASLLFVATEFQQAHGAIRLRQETEDFYKKNARQPNELLRLLAELPVPLFVNTAPDASLAASLKAAFREHRTAHYSFRKGRQQEPLEDPRADCPLVYNLFGTVADTDSLVLTERDRLHFVQDVIQHNEAIPSAILKEMQADKVVIFLGFDFEQWHLRILPKTLLKADDTAAPVLVPSGGGEGLARSTMLFFKKQYRMDFLPLDATGFARELARRWRRFQEKPDGGAAAQSPIEVFYLYDEADADFKDALDKHLAQLKRGRAIRTWDERMTAPGMAPDEQAAEQLDRANLVLMLVSADLLANDQLYEQQLLRAMDRYREGKALVCPVLVRPCQWEGAVFAKLPTVLPRGRRAVAEWDDRDSALRHVAQQLEGFVEQLLENLTT